MSAHTDPHHGPGQRADQPHRRAPGRTTASGARRRPLLRSAWGFTAALLFVVLGSVLAVDELHDRSHALEQAQGLAGELEQDAGELRTAEAALTAGDPVAPAGAELDDELGDLLATSTQLRELHDSDVATEMQRGLSEAGAALRAQLAVVEAGDTDAAEQVARRRTAPALDALDVQVTATVDHYTAAAERATRVGELGLWVALLTAGLAIAGLSWRHERARRASQAALEERLQQRVAEVAEITERHEQLEAMKYSFVSAVSHELRTPLTAIHGSLEMLEDGDVGPLTTDAAQVVSVAARGTRRLSRLVEDIIDLERLETGSFGFYPGVHDVHALLLETVESLTPLADRAGVVLVLDEASARVWCDRDRVQQALTNLVGNAIKFSSPAGAIHLGARSARGEVEVTVRDEGRGIPAEQLDAVFDRFHQVDTRTDQAKGGAGLGLTITRHIIEAQGGRIWVESEYGAGTRFRFTLPTADTAHEGRQGGGTASGRPALLDPQVLTSS